MPARSYLWIFIALLAGILLGRISLTAGAGGADGREARHDQQRAAASGVSGDGSPVNVRPRERPIQVPGAGRVSIPLETGKELLAQGNYLDCSFEVMDGRIEKALALLGADARRQEEAKALFERTRGELLAAEKEHVRVRASGPSTIHLNMFDMEKPAHEIIRRLQGNLRTILDESQAEALSKSINWSNYYRTGFLEEVSLEVLRMDGGLYRMEKSAGYSRQTRLGNDTFPPDSQSIPAQEAFKAADHPDPRLRARDWSHLLQGRNLVPVQKTDSIGG